MVQLLSAILSMCNDRFFYLTRSVAGDAENGINIQRQNFLSVGDRRKIEKYFSITFCKIDSNFPLRHELLCIFERVSLSTHVAKK